MSEASKKIPPVFITFERYDTKTSFGFDDFEARISLSSLSVEILHLQAGAMLLLEKPGLLDVGQDLLKSSQQNISVDEDESVRLLCEMKSLNPGIDVKFFSIPCAENDSLSSSTAIRTPEENDGRIRFLGPLNGRKREMLSGILFASSNPENILSRESAEWAASLNRELCIKVFVSHTCPSCPPAAIVCGALCAASPFIYTDIIDVKDFRNLADRHGVIGLPRVVVNDKSSFIADSGPSRLIRDIRKSCE